MAFAQEPFLRGCSGWGGPTHVTPTPESTSVVDRGNAGAAAARRGAMDVAAIATMRDGLLRVSEAAALTWGDIQPQPDGSGLLRIRRSKTDALGEGVLLYLGEEAMRTLGALRPESAAPDSTVFGLHSAAIAARIRAAAVAAGLGDGFTGHSGRVGMAQDLVAAGGELPAIMVAGRWKSPGMVARYAQGTAAGRGAVARYHRNGQPFQRWAEILPYSTETAQDMTTGACARGDIILVQV